MSDTPRWASICEQERSITLDATSVCQPLDSYSSSPIDEFYTYTAALIPLGTRASLDANDALGKALLLGLVSGTEHYFRVVLSGLVHICPLARRHSAGQPISFGSLEYYPRENMGLALLENLSLATSGELKNVTKRLLKLDINQDNSLEASFKEYEKVCQLRHAAVHSRGDLGPQNLQELGIPKSTVRLAVRIDFSSFHLATSICQNVVRAYNRFLYRKTLERWIAEKLLTAKWQDDRELFSPLFELFYSRKDGTGPSNAFLTYRSLAPTLRKALTRV